MRARGLRICVFSIFGQFYDWFLVLSYFLGVLAAILMMPTCSLCSRPFKTRGTLARHRQLFHNGKSMDDTVPSMIVSLPYFVKQGVPTSQASSTFSAPYSPTRSKSSAKVSPLPHPQKFRLMSASLFHLLCWATAFVRIPVRPLCCRSHRVTRQPNVIFPLVLLLLLKLIPPGLLLLHLVSIVLVAGVLYVDHPGCVLSFDPQTAPRLKTALFALQVIV